MRKFDRLPIKIFSFEIKKHLDFGNYKEYFFQAVSNSSWANEGYLAALSVPQDGEFREALQKLSQSFGIGIILLDAANLSHPQRNHNVTVVREGNGDGDLLAVFIQDWRHGKIAGIVVLVVFFLPAIARQRLREIAVGVQKTHTDQRNTKVRGGFHVITREHAQTARVDRQGRVNAKLH